MIDTDIIKVARITQSEDHGITLYLDTGFSVFKIYKLGCPDVLGEKMQFILDHINDDLPEEEEIPWRIDLFKDTGKENEEPDFTGATPTSAALLPAAAKDKVCIEYSYHNINTSGAITGLLKKKDIEKIRDFCEKKNKQK